MTPKQRLKLNERIASLIADEGIKISSWYYSDRFKNLEVIYTSNTGSDEIYIEADDLNAVLWIDESIDTIEGGEISDDFGITYGFEEYFDVCPTLLISHFLAYYFILNRAGKAAA